MRKCREHGPEMEFVKARWTDLDTGDLQSIVVRSRLTQLCMARLLEHHFWRRFGICLASWLLWFAGAVSARMF